MSSLKKNIASLYALQIANYAVPLFTLPCLTRALGPEGFGRYSFSLAFNAYLILLVDFGFNYSATQQIARSREDPRACARIFWSTSLVRGSLALVGLAVLVLCTLGIDRLAVDRALLLTGFLTVLGSLLTPYWYFQGTEQLALLSGITVILRIASIPLTYFLVHTPQDIAVAIVVNAAPSIGCGLICLGLLWRRRALAFTPVRARDLLATLKDGWHLFASTAAVSLYSTSNVVVLGFVAGNVAVGYFSAAEKIARAACGLIYPISQSFYPRISRLIESSRDEAFALIRRLLRMQAAFGLLLSTATLLLAPFVVRLFYGSHFAATVEALRWLAPLPFLLALSNVLGVQAMIPLGMKRAVTGILVSAGAVNLVLLSALASLYGADGAAASVTLAETLVSGLMMLSLWSKQLPVFPRFVKTQVIAK